MLIRVDKSCKYIDMLIPFGLMIQEWGAESLEWGAPSNQVIVKFCETLLLCPLVKVFSFLEARTHNPEGPKILGTEEVNFSNGSLESNGERDPLYFHPLLPEGT